MFSRFFLSLLIFINFYLNLNADEKQSIINRLKNINNITFNFKQITNDKTETGSCLLVFDSKLKCTYEDEIQKEILINNKTLVIMKKKYGKVYFYPISNSSFVNILNKYSLINLVQKSNLELNNNINLIYIDNNNKKITIFFDKKNFDLIGWKVDDQFQNEIYFSLKIQHINSEYDPNVFKVPTIN